MQANITIYNFLIVGKSGAGKSATTKLLTGNPSIAVANSLKQVTKQANFYQGISFPVNGKYIKFRILDIPGLDKINNRFLIRQKILKILQKQKISLNGIFYISSLTQRDTIDNQKLFKFIQQMPWSNQLKKNCLIPIFTKYDNLIIDSLDQQIRSTKLQYKQIFQKAGCSLAWSKRIYWINQTKSLDFKMKTYSQIKVMHQKQIQRLIQMIQRNKSNTLNTKQIMLSIQKQQRYILQKLFQKMHKNKLPFRIQNKKYNLSAKIELQSNKVSQSVTTLSASSIGLFLAKVLQKQISTVYSIALMGLPIAIALLNIKTTNSVLHGKKVSQESSGVQLIQTYERLCHLINLEVQNQWKQFNNRIQLTAYENYFYFNVTGQNNFKFIDTQKLKVSMDQKYFQCISNQILKYQSEQINQTVEKRDSIIFNQNFRIKLPKIQQQILWQPVIQIQYGIKMFDQNSILKQIQELRQQYYNQMKE